jgi:adenine-specific DNA-methyltransferase
MTELIWDGKYKDGKKVGPVRVALPFQTIETVNESAQDRGKTMSLFAQGKPAVWKNRLIWGDKKYVLPSLLPEFAGKVNLIYIDPPFDTGSDFSFTTEIPESDESLTKQPSIIEQKAYRDTWGKGLDSYLQWFYEMAVVLHDLLAEDGSLYVHLDYNIIHYAKIILDQVFGLENFRNEIVWKRTSARSGANRWGSIHDTILLYSKSSKHIWNKVLISYDGSYLDSKYKYSDDRGVYRLDNLTAPGVTSGSSNDIWRGFSPSKIGRHWAVPVEALKSVLGERQSNELSSNEKLNILYDNKFIELPKKPDGFPQFKRYLGDGMPVQDVVTDISPVNSQATDRLGYPTQKPEALLERIIKASSNPGDLVLDCFCGSGTTAAVSEKLGRRWITCDLGRFAIHTARKRLLSIDGVKPFVVQNLGKYERQAWMTAAFDTPEDRATKETAYRTFILDLYKADSLTGYVWLHGVKSKRMIHVGSVDAPVTLEDIKAIARETWQAAGANKSTKAQADILGWDFAFELNETAKQIAAEAKVELHFKRIPRDVMDKRAIEQGDIQAKDFFELRALSAKSTVKKRLAMVELTDFIMPSEDLPAEIANEIKHWSQWVDYWAIDWEFKNDTFHNEWQSYRTKDRPKLELSASHEYKTAGSYTVVVKVIDILGNDTTKAITIEVR